MEQSELEAYNKFLQNYGNLHNLMISLDRPFVGKNYEKYRIFVIGQNSLRGFEKEQFSSYDQYRDDYVDKLINLPEFSRKTAFTILTLIADVLYNGIVNGKHLNLKEWDSTYYNEVFSKEDKVQFEELFNLITFTNIVKIPSDGEGKSDNLRNDFDIKYPKIEGKYCIEYEIEMLKPNIILILGRETMGLFRLLPLTSQTNTGFLYQYKNIPVIEFYHPSSRNGEWNNEEKNHLTDKKNKITEILKIKATGTPSFI